MRDQKLLLERAAVHDAVRTAGSRAGCVNEASQELLPDAALAADRDRPQDPSQLTHLAQNLEEGAAPADVSAADEVTVGH